jgi:DNA repair exonuclease SbcCD ATPase subunit
LRAARGVLYRSPKLPHRAPNTKQKELLMSPRRPNDNERTTELATYETARTASEPKEEPAKGDDHKISVFWRVFGGTILSIVALVTITLFNNFSGSISELRAELSREREARAELVKKDEFNARISTQYERIRAHDGLKVELEALKERANTNLAAMDALKKDAGSAVDGAKKELTTVADAVKRDALAIDLLKERLAAVEALKKDLAALDAIKEKTASASTELKALRDEVMKVSNEIERNRVADSERKASRDALQKQTDEALKELTKGLQECREKLARLEGAKPQPKDGKGE